MLACFVCFTLRALLLADLVRAQAEGEDSGDFAKGWKRCAACLLACSFWSRLLLGTGVVAQTSILHGRFYFAKILSVRLFETAVSCFCPSLTTPHVYLPSALAGGVSLRLS